MVTLPCDTPVQLEVPYPDGAWISVEIGGRQVAEAAARVTDLFIVGMGDSFASGEGNPDVPVRFSPDRTTDYGVGSNNAPLTGYPARVGDWKTIGDLKFIEENARWQDQACHRSLYSHQLRAALQLAVEDPHRAVTFVGFACSGAETTFGLFLEYKGNEWVPNPPDLPQISAVAEAQCGGKGARNYDLPEAYHINESIPELKGGLVLKKCDAERARKIDLLFLSVGGNDIGFARLVANAVLADKSILRPSRRLVRPRARLRRGRRSARCPGRPAEIGQPRAAQPPARAVVGVRPGHPDRLPADGAARRRQDRVPGRAVRHDGAARVRPERGQGARGQHGGGAAQRHHAGERPPASWTFAEAHRATFRGRGLCAGYSDAPWTMADELRIPRKVDGAWEPFNPSQWRAYAPRQRLFRTPNDAFMTGNFHVAELLMQKVLNKQGYAWVQLLLASVYSGAFHPPPRARRPSPTPSWSRPAACSPSMRARARASKRVDLGLPKPDGSLRRAPDIDAAM